MYFFKSCSTWSTVRVSLIKNCSSPLSFSSLRLPIPVSTLAEILVAPINSDKLRNSLDSRVEIVICTNGKKILVAIINCINFVSGTSFMFKSSSFFVGLIRGNDMLISACGYFFAVNWRAFPSKNSLQFHRKVRTTPRILRHEFLP